jgi:hypothetical protein
MCMVELKVNTPPLQKGSIQIDITWRFSGSDAYLLKQKC